MVVSPLHVLNALILAALIVTVPMGHILFTVPWLAVVFVAWKSELRFLRGTSTVTTYLAVTAAVVIAATLAPVKTVERVRDRRLVLPKVEMTLAEMDQEANFEQAHSWLPGYIWLTSTPENAGQQIHFRTTDITLREFVDTIESQSELRHRFLHCGNGSSILFGGDCCFGLSLR